MSVTETTGTVTPFQYGNTPVRTITVEGEPWFVLADLCKVLGLTSPARVLDRLDSGVSQSHPIVDSLGRTQTATIVSEAGMYEVVIRSDKPEAVAFRRWIAAEVLPTIRKTGAYGQVAPMSREVLLSRAVLEAAAAIAEKDAQIAELEAPAKAWNNLAAASGNYSVAEAAKILSQDPAISVGRDRLFVFMAEQSWVFRSRNPRGGWEAYQEQVDRGRLYERPARPFLNAKTGEYELPAPTIRVTVKGIEKLRTLLGGRQGFLALTGGAA